MNDEAREREAKAALERVRRDAESIGTSSVARAGRRFTHHLAAKDVTGDAANDPAEIWGRRLGRALSVIGALVLAYLLGVQLRLW